ncbi:MAG TPA: SUMF1/EgtB/PvdO family nonheme iron enzyme [Clostridiales bacterium]|nr:SUMF1/EgtB/PvdO family nonheme iron enzyme [Clostridiales bacterium]
MRLFQLTVLQVIFYMIIGCCAPSKNMIFVKGGEFVSNYKEKNKPAPEKIKIEDYYIGMYEVTQAQWMTVMEKNPSYFIGDSLPVENVNWYNAVIFCNKLSEKEGLDKCYDLVENVTDSNNFKIDLSIKYQVTWNPQKNGYRLPTEAEWEYASRGGRNSKGFRYSGSDDIDEVGWHIRNSGDKVLTDYIHAAEFDRDSIEMYHNSTKVVGRKKPNELGIYDMTGNVYEYCWDFKDYIYTNYLVEPGDPIFGSEILVHLRTAIGGSWLYDIGESTVTDRMFIAPYGCSRDNGLRVVRNKKCRFF